MLTMLFTFHYVHTSFTCCCVLIYKYDAQMTNNDYVAVLNNNEILNSIPLTVHSPVPISQNSPVTQLQVTDT